MNLNFGVPPSLQFCLVTSHNTLSFINLNKYFTKKNTRNCLHMCNLLSFPPNNSNNPCSLHLQYWFLISLLVIEGKELYVSFVTFLLISLAFTGIIIAAYLYLWKPFLLLNWKIIFYFWLYELCYRCWSCDIAVSKRLLTKLVQRCFREHFRGNSLTYDSLDMSVLLKLQRLSWWLSCRKVQSWPDAVVTHYANTARGQPSRVNHGEHQRWSRTVMSLKKWQDHSRILV